MKIWNEFGKKSTSAVLLILTIVGCVSENTLTKVSVVPTNTITIHLPTSTPTLIQPTLTPYLTPFPTLSSIASIEKLYSPQVECDKPCLYGITPGVSTWTETQQFIQQFDGYMGNVVDKTDQKIDKSASYNTYAWYVNNPMPGTDYAPYIGFEVQNNVVSAIYIPHEFVWYFFPLHKLFEKYGKPDKILIDLEDSFRIYVLYEGKRIMTRYSFPVSDMMNPLNVCLSENYSEGPMVLWASNTKLDLFSDSLKPLEDYSAISVDDFYEKFIDKSNRCFELSTNPWK